MDLDVLIPLWRAALANDLADRTVRSYEDHVRAFLGVLASPHLTAITPSAIEVFKKTKAVRCGPKTVGLALTAVRSFVRWQIAADLRADDPTLKVRFPKAPKALPRALSDEQVRTLLAALVEPAGLHPAPRYQWRRNRRAIYLMLYTGQRIMEVGDLRWRDVLLTQRKIVIRDGKGEKDRALPLHPVVVDELESVADGARPNDAVCGHPTGEPLSPKSWHHVFERWVPRLGLGFKLTSHQLRHTFITKLIDLGANIFQAQELAGHESPETTRIYYRLSAEHLRAAVNRLPTTW